MRGAFVFLGVVAAFLALLAFLPSAEATTTCHATGNWCQGYAHASTTTGGVSSARCFALRATNTAPTCSLTGITPSNEASWELDPGACMNVYWFDTTTGVTPPLAPNKVTIAVYFDSLTASPKITFLNAGAEPANGSSYSVCSTDNILSSGAARSGTLRLFIRPVKDNGPGGVGNYDITSDGAATVGTNVGFDKGAIRGLAYVSSITRNAYPAGATFAYGSAGDESMTITATMTAPNGDDNAENIRNFIADDATLVTYGANGASVDLETASPSLAQSFTVDSTFPAAGSPYVGGVSILGNSKLTGLKWTAFPATGHGSGLTRFSDIAVYLTANFNVNPEIAFDADGTGTFATADGDIVVKAGSSGGATITVANRGETIYAEWYLFNARGEKLTRSMTFPNEDSGGTTCSAGGSLTPDGSGLYSTTGAIPTSDGCAAAATTIGTDRYYRATNTDQSKRAAQVSIAVSSLYFVDAHLQVAATLVPDDFPTEDATEDFLFEVRSSGGVDASDVIHIWCHVKGVRQDLNIDTSGSAVTRALRDPNAATRLTATTDTASDGWTGVGSLLASTPLGEWVGDCDVSFNGNTGTDEEEFLIDIDGGGGGETIYTGADPLTIFGGNVANGSVPITVHSRLLNGEARVGVADQIFVSVYDWPAMTAVVTGGSVVEVDATNAPGAYVYNLTWPGAGAYLIAANTTDGATPIGAHNVIVLANGTAADIMASLNGHRNDSLEIFGMSFNNLEFDGFLTFLVWLGLVLFFLARSRVFAAFVATLGLIEALIPAIMPGSFLGYLLLLAIGVWIEAVAGEKIYQTWLNKNPKKDRDPQ